MPRLRAIAAAATGGAILLVASGALAASSLSVRPTDDGLRDRLRGGGSGCPSTGSAEITGTIGIDGIGEVSGVVASRRHPGLLWIEEDSGNPARIYGVDLQGSHLETVDVTGAENRDWEDIALAGGRIWLADIGDNAEVRTSVQIYSFREPHPSTTSVTASRLTLTYPDGPHNAEALFVDGRRGNLFIVTKQEGTAGVYRTSIAGLGSEATRRLRLIETLSLNRVTAADLDGSGIVIKSGDGRWYRWDSARRITSTLERSPCVLGAGPGEAIGFTRSPRGLVAIPEGSGPSIYFTPVDF
jgi:hypothetical protein